MLEWLRHLIGFDVPGRVSRLEARMAHNEKSVHGAVDAFKQLARDMDRGRR